MDTAQQLADQSNEQENPETPVVNVIEVPSLNEEEMAALVAHINVNHDSSVNTKVVKFNFKRSTDKETGIITDRKSVELPVPYPSVEGIVAMLEAGGQELELLVDAVEKVVTDRVRDFLSEDISLSAATLPVDQLTWKVIAALPKSQRRGSGIPKETWELFQADYIEVMPEVTGKTVEQIANAAKILFNKFSAVKTNEPVLNLLVDQLAVYQEAAANFADYAECVDFLISKAHSLLNVSDEDLLQNL